MDGFRFASFDLRIRIAALASVGIVVARFCFIWLMWESDICTERERDAKRSLSEMVGKTKTIVSRLLLRNNKRAANIRNACALKNSRIIRIHNSLAYCVIYSDNKNKRPSWIFIAHIDKCNYEIMNISLTARAHRTRRIHSLNSTVGNLWLDIIFFFLLFFSCAADAFHSMIDRCYT